VVGLLGLWLVVESLTGLCLYGSSVGKRAGSRRLHRVVGALSLALTVMVGLTGAVLAIAGALGFASAGTAGALTDVDQPPFAAGLRRLDAVATRIERASPGARIGAVVSEGVGVLRVEARRLGSDRLSTIRVDSGTGEMLDVRSDEATGWGLVRRLHAGDVAGVGSRTLYALAGLALPLLSVSGLLAAVRRRSRAQSSKVFT
jgi:hypothetical protein